MTFLVCLLLLDYGPIMGLFKVILTFHRHHIFSLERSSARLEVLETSANDLSTKILERKKKTAVARLISNELV